MTSTCDELENPCHCDSADLDDDLDCAKTKKNHHREDEGHFDDTALLAHNTVKNSVSA